jgi:hypothetical protein
VNLTSGYFLILEHISPKIKNLINDKASSYFMRRIVEYQIPKDQFLSLVEHLNETNQYQTHSYAGMEHSTIDDGKSTDFDHCKHFSVFKEIEEDKLIELRVKNFDLAKTIDSYFVSKELI